MTFTRLVTKCIAFLSPDDDHHHLPLDHCAVCQQHHQPSQLRQQTKLHLVPNTIGKSSASKSESAHHHKPKETKIKKTTANWKLNCAKLISGAKSTCSSSTPSSSAASSVMSSSTNMHATEPQPATTTPPSATTCGSAEFQLHDTASSPPPSHHFKETLFSLPSTNATVNHLSIVEDTTNVPNEDCDETARLQRAREIARGVEPPPGYLPMFEVRHSKVSLNVLAVELSDANQQQPILGSMPAAIINLNDQPVADTINARVDNGKAVVSAAESIASAIGEEAMQRLLPSLVMTESTAVEEHHHPRQHIVGPPPIHSQVDFMHCLVPDLKKITSSCFYWGKMDRYEAERLLDGKPEGTFLLRDSAQEEFLFSVSFRKYGRSLHARIEQFNHMFSFDCHDPAVATSPSVTGLLEHYKNPQRVMFFEPALTLPLNRNFCFSLQQLCRASIVSQTSYTGIASLTLPVTLKSYLKEYHYKQRVRTKRYDD